MQNMPRYYTEEQGKKYGRKVEQQNRLRILILFKYFADITSKLNCRWIFYCKHKIVALTLCCLFTVPTRPPRQVQGIKQSSTSLLITWITVPSGHAHGVIICYNVYVNNGSVRVLSTSVNNAVLTGLNKYTQYTVQVSANTSTGEGPRSSPISVWTDEDGE